MESVCNLLEVFCLFMPPGVRMLSRFTFQFETVDFQSAPHCVAQKVNNAFIEFTHSRKYAIGRESNIQTSNHPTILPTNRNHTFRYFTSSFHSSALHFIFSQKIILQAGRRISYSQMEFNEKLSVIAIEKTQPQIRRTSYTLTNHQYNSIKACNTLQQLLCQRKSLVYSQQNPPQYWCIEKKTPPPSIIMSTTN